MPRISRTTPGVSPAARCAGGMLVAAALLRFAQGACAEDPPLAAEDPGTRTRAAVLINGMLQERLKIVSGIVHVQGSIAFTKGAPPPERTIRTSYAFDHSQGVLRFDGTRRMQVRRLTPEVRAAAGNNLKAAMDLAKPEDVEREVTYLATRDLTTLWTSDGKNMQSQMTLGPAGREFGAGTASTYYPLDLRACGIISRFDLDSGNLGIGTGVKDYCANLLKLSVVSVTERELEAVIVLRSEFAEFCLTIDTVHQLTPVEFQRTWKKGPGNSSDGSTTSRVKWSEIDGLMVPKSFTFEFDWPDEKEYSLSTFACLWKSVNQPIDKSYFDYKAFSNIPSGTQVVDFRRKEKPVVVGFWTDTGIVGPEDGSEDGPAGVDPTAPQPGDAQNLQTLIEGTKAGQERNDNGLKMRFVWCPPGRFVMGSPPGEPERFEAEDQVDVILTRGFWIGKFEVTQGEWVQLKTPLLWQGQDHVKEGEDFPAVNLSWENAMAFCRKLTRQERAAGRLPPGWNYTLPTEAQWEYACRAGTTTRFSFGEDDSLLGDYAWFRDLASVKYGPSPHPVGQKKPNPWGLYDMYGNVSEWCRDGWLKKLPGGTDPFVPGVDDMRVIRGGQYNFPGVLCKSAFREVEHARGRTGFIGALGLRVVLCPVTKE